MVCFTCVYAGFLSEFIYILNPTLKFRILDDITADVMGGKKNPFNPNFNFTKRNVWI